VRTFDFVITDDRFDVPTLAFVSVRDPERALELAKQRLGASPHYTAIEVREEGMLLARIERDG
jgi:hypothetical protein